MKEDHSMPWLYYPAIGDENGSLSVLESNKSIPFDIKRVFYVYGTKKGVIRGRHAHYKMREVLIAVSGSCQVSLDNTFRRQIVLLDSPNKALLVEPYEWREMFDFSEDCVLLALASEFYDPEDYIRDYNEFLKVYVNLLRGAEK